MHYLFRILNDWHPWRIISSIAWIHSISMTKALWPQQANMRPRFDWHSRQEHYSGCAVANQILVPSMCVTATHLLTDDCTNCTRFHQGVDSRREACTTASHDCGIAGQGFGRWRALQLFIAGLLSIFNSCAYQSHHIDMVFHQHQQTANVAMCEQVYPAKILCSVSKTQKIAEMVCTQCLLTNNSKVLMQICEEGPLSLL